MCRMSGTRTCGWLVLLVCIPITFQTEAAVPITLVESAVNKGAVCLDGSPPAYHLDRGFGSGINSWLVHLEGGGWCHNVSHCLGRKTYHLGSSKYMPKQIHFAAILSGSQRYNPYFYNWNRVEVRYCDGSSFTGDVEKVDPATNLHYRGARVWLAVMEDLLSKGMNASENAILTGGSAGGLAAILQCDNFRALLPLGAKVKCVSDGGYFVDLNDTMGKPHIRTYFDLIVTLHGSAKNLPSSCTTRMTPSLCFFPQYLVEQIQTPLFVVNAAYDSWQIKNVLAPADDDPTNEWRVCKTDIKLCSPKQLEKMQDFRLKFLDTFAGLNSSLSNGWFINSCYVHLQTELQNAWFAPNSTKLADTTIAAAVGGWYYDELPFRQIDCPYPCDSTCA